MVGVAHCTVSGGAVTVRYEDNSTVYIPAEVVSRSTVLEQALQPAHEEREFKLPAQDVRLQSWADTASSLVHGPAKLDMFDSLTIGEALTDNNLLVLLKGAAHGKYMDRVSAPGACRQQTFSWIRAPYMIQLVSWVVASALTMQILRGLSEDLARAVLQASPCSLQHHMSVLPADLHYVSIQAALPSALSEGIIELDASAVSTRTASTMLHQFSGNPSVRCFSLSNLPSVPVTSTASEEFHSAAGSMLRDCNTTTARFFLQLATPGTLETLSSMLGVLEHNYQLRTLHIGHPAPHRRSNVQSVDVKSLFQLVHVVSTALSMTSLHSLSELTLCWGMGRFDLDDYSQKAMSRSLQQLTLLTALQLDCGMGNTAVLAEALRHLSHLQKLSLSVYLRAAKKRHARTDRKPFLQSLASLRGLLSFHLSISFIESGSFPLGLSEPLLNLTNLQHLDLGSVLMRSEEVLDLSRALRAPKLQSLAVCVGNVDSEVAGMLVCVAESSASTCTSLSLSSNIHIYRLMRLHEKFYAPGPEQLVLPTVASVVRTTARLPALLAQLTALQNLSLHNCTLGDTEVLRTLRAMANAGLPDSALFQSVLQLVHQPHAALQQAQSIAQINTREHESIYVLSSLSRLRDLRLSAQSGGTDQPAHLHPWRGLRDAAVQHFSHLHTLQLHGYNICADPSGVELLSQLHLCRLSVDSVGAIASPFPRSSPRDSYTTALVRQLTYLELALRGGELQSALKGVPRLCCIQHLALRCIGVGDSATRDLAVALEESTDLVVLDLHGSRFSGDEHPLGTLLGGAPVLSGLTRLDLPDCLFSCPKDGMLHVLPCLHRLRTISLSEGGYREPPVKQRMCQQLLGSLHTLQHLQNVEFRGQDCSPETWSAVERFVRAVPSLRRYVVDFVPEQIPSESAQRILDAFSADDPLRCVLPTSVLPSLVCIFKHLHLLLECVLSTRLRMLLYGA